MIVAAVVLLMFAFAASVVLSSVQHAVERWLPVSDEVAGANRSTVSAVPALALFVTFYVIVLRADAVSLSQAAAAGNGPAPC